MRLFKMLFLFILCLSFAFADDSPKATEEQQQEVKERVMKSLEDYYQQSFKLENFDYKYESYSSPQNDCVFLYCKSTKIGTYYFKIQAVDNPIIVINFDLVDNPELYGKEKESIKWFIL